MKAIKNLWQLLCAALVATWKSERSTPLVEDDEVLVFHRVPVIGAAEDDDIEALMEAAEADISGLENVGGDDGDAPQRAGLRRQGREIVKRRPLGFGAPVAILTTATQVYRATPKRAVRINRILVTPSAVGCVINSIKMGDLEQALTEGVAVEAYGVAALTDSVPDNFDPVPANTEITIEIENPTAGTITVGVTAKCAVLSTGA